jgi:hypothetical protein
MRTCHYKGRAYQLLWEGNTRYGHRAHLRFLDGSKEFWVDAGNISHVAGSTVNTRRESYSWHCDCCGAQNEGPGDMCVNCGA